MYALFSKVNSVCSFLGRVYGITGALPETPYSCAPSPHTRLRGAKGGTNCVMPNFVGEAPTD